jgi:carboxylesterase type B
LQRNREGKFIKVVSENLQISITPISGAGRVLSSAVNAKILTFKQPLLIGNNDNEAGFFTIMNPKQKLDPAAAKKQNAGFECPSGAAADARRLQGIPSWRYRYMPNKAVHGAEIASVFGTMEGMGRNTLTTTNTRALSKAMMQAWAAFAKDPQNGLTKIGWPKYNPLGKTLILLGEGNGPGATFAFPAEYDGFCDEYWKSNTPMSLSLGATGRDQI